MSLSDPIITVLGEDPGQRRRCILNVNAFQQDAVVTFLGWQYAVFYGYLSRSRPGLNSGEGLERVDTGLEIEPLYVHVARRELTGGGLGVDDGEKEPGKWEILVLDDYPQTVDDGHNTVQMGICPGDGTIHLAFDHHCDVLHYRHSTRNLALSPASFPWTPTLFTTALSHLPGIPLTHPHFADITYPRFGFLGQTNMFLSFRDGKAGLGNDHLYMYHPDRGVFSFIGTHLTGVLSNPYVNGMDYRNGKFHITWVWRGFVEYEGWDDPFDMKHKQQAGPNGAENNHDLCYAYSENLGWTWRNGGGVVIADLRPGETAAMTISNAAEGIIAVEIPRGKGLMNQEAQAVDSGGGVHVLNRDCMDGGEYMWKHYYRCPEDGSWTQHSLQRITSGSRRGRLAVSKDDDLYAILPDSVMSTMRILKGSKADGYSNYEEVWVGKGLFGEPLVDSARLQHDNVLSLFVMRVDEGVPERRNVVILDFNL